MRVVKVEEWVSNENLEEIHYFIEGERNSYIFGYNPNYMTQNEAEELLKKLGFTSGEISDVQGVQGEG